MTSTTMVLAAVGGLNTLLTLAVQLAFLVVTLTVVRRQRPDAVPVLLSSVALDFVGSVVAFLEPLLLGRFLALSTFAQVNAISAVVVTIVHSGARILILFALVALCRPAPSSAPTFSASP